MTRISRRQMLSGAAGAGLLSLAGPVRPRVRAATGVNRLPSPRSSGIRHVVLVMMENRSFDHLLGWLPGARGMQVGLMYLDRTGAAHATYALAPDYQGCGHPDPNHSYAGGRAEYNGGRCDGWLRAGLNDTYAIGYYGQSDLPFLGNMAPQWTVLDNYYAAIMSETFPNRMYQHAGQTDRLDDAIWVSTLPTIWDRLAAAGVSGCYYYSDLPFLALWGLKYAAIGRPFSRFLTDCADGKLPSVAFVDPPSLGEDTGLSGDDHPHGDVRRGEAFLSEVYRAVTTGPGWRHTLLVISFDEWGGFFDHVAPHRARIPPASRAAGDTDGLRGFRVPALLISPWSPRGKVAHTRYDHTSVLRLIEWRWGLKPLTVRDATANNLATALDFRSPNLHAPGAIVPQGPFGGACTVGVSRSSRAGRWQLREMAQEYGWPVY